jgi:hypothetical protein
MSDMILVKLIALKNSIDASPNDAKQPTLTFLLAGYLEDYLNSVYSAIFFIFKSGQIVVVNDNQCYDINAFQILLITHSK